MATEGKARPGPRDDYPFAPDEVPVVEWSGEVEHDDGSEEALFAATERRLVCVTRTGEEIVDYTRIAGVETRSESGESAGGSYRDLTAGGVVFTAAGLGTLVIADRIIGMSVGVVVVLIGVLLLLDVLRNLRSGSGMMTIEATVEHIRLDRVDAAPLQITATERVATRLCDLIADARDEQ